MSIEEIYAEMDACQSHCDGCWVGCYHRRGCPVVCPVAQIMYRLCDEFDQIMIRQRLDLN